MVHAYQPVHTGPVASRTSFVRISPKRHRRDRPHLVAVLAFDGVVLADLAVPCEVLARVFAKDGHRAYEIRVCAEHTQVASEHASLSVRWRLATLRRAETIIVPGIDDLDRAVSEAVKSELRRAIRRGARVASICTGAFLLGAVGALNGRRATTHWLAAGELARRYPAATVDANVLYVDNGAVLTSAGAAAGVDLCLHLVRQDFGASIAAQAARAAVMPLERAGGQAQFIVYESPAAEGTAMGTVLEWIEHHLTSDLSLAALARRSAMSVRTFCRRFHEQVGTTPAVWIAQARLRRAQKLLETTELSVERIATEAGLGSSTVLRQYFSRRLGTTPRAYRLSFATPRDVVANAPHR